MRRMAKWPAVTGRVTGLGTEVGVTRGKHAKNKDHLGSDHARSMLAKPAARRDEFGSQHNVDGRRKAQEQSGRPRTHGQNLPFRESAQDVQPDRGAKNKGEVNRRRPRP